MPPKQLIAKFYKVHGGPLWDLFFGEGWEDWTRVRILKGDKLHVMYIAGKERPIGLLLKLIKMELG